MEALTKFALNSTLGTKDFKPLNELINDLIESKIRYISSDNVISVLGSNISLNTTEKELLTKTMKHDGVLSVRIIKPNDFDVYVYVDKNNERILSLFAGAGTVYSSEFEFSKDDEIKISARAQDKYGVVESISLLGMASFGDF